MLCSPEYHIEFVLDLVTHRHDKPISTKAHFNSHPKHRNRNLWKPQIFLCIETCKVNNKHLPAKLFHAHGLLMVECPPKQPKNFTNSEPRKKTQLVNLPTIAGQRRTYLAAQKRERITDKISTRLEGAPNLSI